MYTLISPSYRCFISNLALIGRAVSEIKIFQYYGDTHVYCTGGGGGGGADQPQGSIFFRIINLQSIWHLPILFKLFSLQNDILTIFPIQIYR